MSGVSASKFGIPRLFLVAALIFVIPAAFAGCGKKGLPQPDYSEQHFSWRNVSATRGESGCLTVNGQVSGQARNVQYINLELQEYDQDCLGCPFVPTETHRVDAAQAWQGQAGESFRFTYCPGRIDKAYRWRLSGQNVYQGMPQVLTPVRLIAAPEGLASDPLISLPIQVPVQ